MIYVFFFFNDTATTEIYTLSLHDALPIFPDEVQRTLLQLFERLLGDLVPFGILLPDTEQTRSEEHTSELQSQSNLVCRLLLEKKNPPPPPPPSTHPPTPSPPLPHPPPPPP